MFDRKSWLYFKEARVISSVKSDDVTFFFDTSGLIETMLNDINFDSIGLACELFSFIDKQLEPLKRTYCTVDVLVLSLFEPFFQKCILSQKYVLIFLPSSESIKDYVIKCVDNKQELQSVELNLDLSYRNFSGVKFKTNIFIWSRNWRSYIDHIISCDSAIILNGIVKLESDKNSRFLVSVLTIMNLPKIQSLVCDQQFRYALSSLSKIFSKERFKPYQTDKSWLIDHILKNFCGHSESELHTFLKNYQNITCKLFFNTPETSMDDMIKYF